MTDTIVYAQQSVSGFGSVAVGRILVVFAVVGTVGLSTSLFAAPPARLNAVPRSAHRVIHANMLASPASHRAPPGRYGSPPMDLPTTVAGVVNRPSVGRQDSTEANLTLRRPLTERPRQVNDGAGNRSPWAATGAALFDGSLSYGGRSLFADRPDNQLAWVPPHRLYRHMHGQLDQTRKFIVSLYAIGDSVLTAGLIVMADDDPAGLTAKIGPAWMHGRPAARLEVVF